MNAENTHPASRLHEGQRVELLRDIDRYPHFIASKGMTGTLVIVDGHEIHMRLDETLPGAEEWDNEVCWYFEDIDHIGEDIAPLEA